MSLGTVFSDQRIIITARQLIAGGKPEVMRVYNFGETHAHACGDDKPKILGDTGIHDPGTPKGRNSTYQFKIRILTNNTIHPHMKHL